MNEARVILKIKVTQHLTNEQNKFEMELFDNGNGDPDIRSNDGIYSRYFTNFQAGEGRYDIQIHVDNKKGTAYTYQPKIFKGEPVSVVNFVLSKGEHALQSYSAGKG